jgi:RES domain/HEPN/RES N-terminal domain 1
MPNACYNFQNFDRVTEMLDSDQEEISTRRICATCVTEQFLKGRIENEGVAGSCFYCTDEGLTISMGQLADIIETAFRDHYVRTSDVPDTDEERAIKYCGAEFDRSGDPVVEAIAKAAGIDDEVAEHIQEILSERHAVASSDYIGEESEFDFESYYEKKALEEEDDVLGRKWDDFCNQLQTESRFFSQSAETVLDSIFSETATHQTHEGHPVIKNAGPGTEMPFLFRGRYFQSREEMEEALKHGEQGLGPPSSRLASPGRMNAGGISVFYGATSPEVVLSEIRPPVGSHVVIGQFNLTRNIRLLDIMALASIRVPVSSIFDKDYVRRSQQALFYKTLGRLISVPVMPNDQLFEYLPTQVVTDYLASRAELALDGIIYRSAQGASLGVNVVLFHKASRVEIPNYPGGTEYHASLWGGDPEERDTEYLVSIKVPHPEALQKQRLRASWHDFGDCDMSWAVRDPDPRPVTLQLDPSSLVTRRILRVSFDTADLQVRIEHGEQLPKVEEPF